MRKQLAFSFPLLFAGSILVAGSITWDFDSTPLNTSPAGWKTTSAATSGAPVVVGDGAATVKYLAVVDATAPAAGPNNRVIRLDNTKTAEYGAGHHLWTDGPSLADGTIECDIKAEDTKKGNGGLSFRMKDPKTFYAVRLQLSGEPGIALFKVKDGRILRTGATTGATPVFGAGKWFRLRVTFSGDNIKVAVDGKEYMDFTDLDDPIRTAGGVGLFARGNESIICWDNLA
jgi:hypothetical protein